MSTLAQIAAAEIDFQSMAAHKLRTPLAAVLIQLEILADKLEGEEAELAGAALRSTRPIERVVEQLLAVSRLDAGQRRERGAVDLAERVIDVVDELECMTHGHRLSVTVDRVVVSGARDELHRLLFNLVDNALCHTPAGTEIEVDIVAGREPSPC